MTGRKILNSLPNGQMDIIQVLLDIIAEMACPCCIIAGLAALPSEGD